MLSAAFLPPSALIARLPAHRRRAPARACAESVPRPHRPPPPARLTREPRPTLARAQRAGVPALLNGPEAVLGVVLAAAALLADFAAGIARLAARGVDVRARRVIGAEGGVDLDGDVDVSIEELRRALDASKKALAETEASLDATVARANSAEAAMHGIGDSRDRLQMALDEAARAEREVARVQESLRVERGERERVAGVVGEREEERVHVEAEWRRREVEVAEMRRMLEEVRGGGNEALREHERREGELAREVGQKEEELRSVKREREQLQSEAAEMEKRAATMAEQVSAAGLALEETRRELEEAERDLQKRRAEEKAVEKASAAVVALSAERENLKDALRGMEARLNDMRQELRTRDKIVAEVSLESDQLASLLAARDAELHETQRKLDSATAGETGNGGDEPESDLSLEEIKKNLDAEQLALSAEIAQAELAKSDLIAEDLDPLDRLQREMDAKGDLMQAGLRKAETTVKREEYEQKRKDGAVEDVLQSVQAESSDDSTVGLAASPAVQGAGEGGEVARDDGETQGKAAVEGEPEPEPKPKRRRGRPRKDSTKAGRARARKESASGKNGE